MCLPLPMFQSLSIMSACKRCNKYERATILITMISSNINISPTSVRSIRIITHEMSSYKLNWSSTILHYRNFLIFVYLNNWLIDLFHLLKIWPPTLMSILSSITDSHTWIFDPNCSSIALGWLQTQGNIHNKKWTLKVPAIQFCNPLPICEYNI